MVRLKRIKDQERSPLSLTLHSSYLLPCENVYISSCLFPLLKLKLIFSLELQLRKIPVRVQDGNDLILTKMLHLMMRK